MAENDFVVSGQSGISFDGINVEETVSIIGSSAHSIDIESDLHLSASENDDSDIEQENSTQNSNDWREWMPHDVSFPEFQWNNASGYRPPTEQKPISELEFFQLFFTDELFEQIVKETNRYAKDKIAKLDPLPARSMWHSWKEVTLSELKAFTGVIINMAMNAKPEIDDYCSNDWADYQPFFKDVFSKERFQQIFWNLHIGPPLTGPVTGTLSRSANVRNVVLYLDKMFRQYYCPSNNVSVDESTIGFKGKVIFKVYNKLKPQKWGIKVYVLADSKNGYICAIEPFLGKPTSELLARSDLGMTSRIVLQLVNKLKENYGSVKGMHVFTDRFYTNMDLASELYLQKVHLTGTINNNRKGLPSIVKKKNIRRVTKHEVKAFRKEDKFSLVLWKDVRIVTMLSTLYDNTTEIVRRIKKHGTVETISKPTVICRYNDSMGGVDLADHYISSYAFTRKSIKWWRKVFFWLLEAAIVNAFILYNLLSGGSQQVRQRQFRKRLIIQLIGDIRNKSRRRGRPSNFDDDERLNGNIHLLYPMDARKTKDCVVCSYRNSPEGRKRSKFFCKTCEKQPGLHPGTCFELYHTAKTYRRNT